MPDVERYRTELEDLYNAEKQLTNLRRARRRVLTVILFFDPVRAVRRASASSCS